MNEDILIDLLMNGVCIVDKDGNRVRPCDIPWEDITEIEEVESISFEEIVKRFEK